jgi:gp57
MNFFRKTLEILKRTWNNAVTNESTLNFNLDMFAYSSRDPKQDYEKNKNRFKNALIENDKTALANLLYTLDIRNGKGERALFKSYFYTLIEMNKDCAIQILPYIPELGRWDYVFEGIGTEIEENVYELIRAYLMMDIKNYNENKPVSLLAKWLPSIKTHNKKNYFAVKLAKKLNLTEKEYRKILSKLRDSLNIVEKHITNKEYEKIEYISVPSKAMVKYKNLFFTKDEVRFKEFIEELKDSKKAKYDNLFMNDFAKMYLDNLMKIGINYFYERTIKEACRLLFNNFFLKDLEENSQILLQNFKNEKNLINTMWKKQSKIEFDKNVLVIADTSGSMEGTPFETAISLAIYISQNNKSEEWRNKFIIFSSDCIEYSYDKDAEFTDIIDNIPLIAENTNIDKVFKKILNDSIEKNLPQLDEVIIISDMEFDMVQDKKDMSNFKHWKSEFAKYNYELPKIIFWNVARNVESFPVTKLDYGTCLVSGYSKNILKSIIDIENFDPIDIMLKTLEKKNYFKMVKEIKENLSRKEFEHVEEK